MSTRQTNRRDFLLASTGTAAALATPYFFSSSFAQAEEAPSDRIGVAAIGVGGRGAHVGRQAAALGDILACCDVDRKRAYQFAKPYDGKCDIYGDYRKVLDRSDVDAVTIGTPDHWHTKICIDAMRAGKDVYCEKPLTLTIDEGKKLCQVTKETGRVLQVGTQQRSEYGEYFLKAVAIAQSGRLGKKLKATCKAGPVSSSGPFPSEEPPPYLDWEMWLGQAPLVPYCRHRCHYNFRWWLEYSGGQVTDWGVHLTDIALWAIGAENTGPTEIEGTGNFPKIENGFNVATTFNTTMKFDSGHQIVLASQHGGSILIEGEKGRIEVNRGRLTGKPIEQLTPQDHESLNEQVAKLYRSKQPGNHMRNFFECIKDRSLPISDVYTHHRSVSTCHLANIAMRLGRKLYWDPDKEDFKGDQQASGMLRREQRKPYAIEA